MFCFWEGVMKYRKKIIDLVNKCKNEEILEIIYRFCKRLIG